VADRAAQAPQARPTTGFAAIITFPFHLFGILCGSLLLAILVEWIGMHFLWPQERCCHAEQMLAREIDQLSSNFRQSLFITQPAQEAQRFISWTHEHVVIRSGLHDWLQKSDMQPYVTNRTPDIQRLLSDGWIDVEPYFMAAGYTALTFLVRLLVLLLTLPLSAMAALVGLVDGLVQRDLRRFGAGRESGFVYHRARALIRPIMLTPWVLYLALPVSISPLAILLPGALLLGLTVNVTAATFKKYV